MMHIENSDSSRRSTPIELAVSSQGQRIDLKEGEQLEFSIGLVQNKKTVRLTLVKDELGNLVLETDDEKAGGAKVRARSIQFLHPGADVDLGGFSAQVRVDRMSAGQVITVRLMGHGVMITHLHGGDPGSHPTRILYTVKNPDEPLTAASDHDHTTSVATGVKDQVAAVIPDASIAVHSEFPKIGAANLESHAERRFVVYPSFSADSGVATAPRMAFRSGTEFNEDGAQYFQNGVIVADAMGGVEKSRTVVQASIDAVSSNFAVLSEPSSSLLLSALDRITTLEQRGTINHDSGAAIGIIREKNGPDSRREADLVTCGDVRAYHINKEGTVVYKSLDQNVAALKSIDLNNIQHLAFAAYYFVYNDDIIDEKLYEFVRSGSLYELEIHLTNNRNTADVVREKCSALLASPHIQRRLSTDADQLVFRLDGKGMTFSPNTQTVAPDAGDVLFLCSDGVTGVLTDDEIVDFALRRDFYGMAKLLKQRWLVDDTTFGWKCY